MSLIRKISRLSARHLACHWIPLQQERGVISFSFDDVPASACHQGAALLEQYQARGTFYVCGGLTDGIEQSQPCHSVQDLQRLACNGHEIACHTYAHRNCADTAIPVLQTDWERNQAFFKTHQLPSTGFAFPFGAYGLLSKIAASRRFAYSRITGGGLQTGRADLAALRAQALYANTMTTEQIAALIRRADQQRGWLIFYSHEVSAQPGPWGTSPQQLETALRLASESRCRLLTVQKAIHYFQHGDEGD
ncbi:polysaccharide deacetylase family protein [Undibacterium oligocarboniphilum]|uniref:Polysaccharide deacetylase family protein n=1 Tax=Undibacterium oligocarboniphilum TaxID=666702 RepID=A0A850QBK4_9BURK|nr:polysaccharide deacetylase family protein [Undibacterium oligocarboniphilum]MBC3868669.1 polysaccharide deacetylase family protein [Undibacterium oligocarboniphilum]NVO76649.1 polysaccharide deacetylase family protein [Undibacterium oligocarboniphilum]